MLCVVLLIAVDLVDISQPVDYTWDDVKAFDKPQLFLERSRLESLGFFILNQRITILGLFFLVGLAGPVLLRYEELLENLELRLR